MRSTDILQYIIYTIALYQFLLSTCIMNHTSRYTVIIVICMSYMSLVFWPARDSTSPGRIHSAKPLFPIWSQGTWSHPPRSFGSSSSREHSKWSCEKKTPDSLLEIGVPFFHPNHQVLSPLLCNVSWWIQIPLRSPFQGAEFESRATSNLHLFYTFSDIYPRLGLGTTIKRPKTFYLSIRSSDLFLSYLFLNAFPSPQLPFNCSNPKNTGKQLTLPKAEPVSLEYLGTRATRAGLPLLIGSKVPGLYETFRVCTHHLSRAPSEKTCQECMWLFNIIWMFSMCSRKSNLSCEFAKLQPDVSSMQLDMFKTKELLVYYKKFSPLLFPSLDVII